MSVLSTFLRGDRAVGRCSATLTWSALAALLCAVPAIAMLLGVDFGISSLHSSAPAAAGHFAARGPLIHTMLECCAVLCALFAASLTAVQYSLTKQPSTPIIGIALCCSAAIDGFHILAANGMIPSVAESHIFVPFTWAPCRTANALIILFGVGYFLLQRRGKQRTQILGDFWILNVVLICGTGIAVVWCATSSIVPQTMFPESLIARPYDLLALILFCVCAFVVLPRYEKAVPSPLAAALRVSMIPAIAGQLYMTFGSTALHDASFNIAHVLKPISYAIPIVGMLVVYTRTFRAMNHARKALAGHASELELKNVQLEVARARADDAARTKAEFLANMSHEIRTPMTAILGFVDELAERADKELESSVATIQRNADHLLTIINDVLDFSKIEAGRIVIERRRFNFAQLCGDMEQLFAPRAKLENLDFAISFATPVPQFIESDSTRLRQVMINLIGNALKFTKKGRVALTVRCEDNRHGRDNLLIEISDTGIGIAAEKIESLFDAFCQADESTSRVYGGTGLGLTISKRLVELLHGELKVASTEGSGSTFTLKLPLWPTETEMIENYAGHAVVSGTNAKEDTSNSLDFDILVAEDGPDNQRLIQRILEKAGARVTMVENGAEAITALDDAVTRGKSFDVIIMDMQMPVLDGYSATNRLRESGCRLPILALTAHALTGDRERCLAAGCTDFATKPINRKALIATIANVARSYQQTAGETQPA